MKENTVIFTVFSKIILDKTPRVCYNKDTKNKGDNYYEKE
jgi:hypothetical protein